MIEQCIRAVYQSENEIHVVQHETGSNERLLGVNGAGKTTTMRMITGHTSIKYAERLLHASTILYFKPKERKHDISLLTVLPASGLVKVSWLPCPSFKAGSYACSRSFFDHHSLCRG